MAQSTFLDLLAQTVARKTRFKMTQANALTGPADGLYILYIKDVRLNRNDQILMVGSSYITMMSPYLAKVLDNRRYTESRKDDIEAPPPKKDSERTNR